MSIRDGLVFSSDTVFTQDQLGAIVPNELRRWMCLKTYTAADAGPDANPTFG